MRETSSAADSSADALLSPGKKASRSLGAAVSKWKATIFTNSVYHLDGGSQRSLQRCIAVQCSGAPQAAKMLLCEPSAYTSYPVSTFPFPYCLFNRSMRCSGSYYAVCTRGGSSPIIPLNSGPGRAWQLHLQSQITTIYLSSIHSGIDLDPASQFVRQQVY